MYHGCVCMVCACVHVCMCVSMCVCVVGALSNTAITDALSDNTLFPFPGEWGKQTMARDEMKAVCTKVIS